MAMTNRPEYQEMGRDRHQRDELSSPKRSFPVLHEGFMLERPPIALPTKAGFAPVVVCFERLSAERGKIRDHFDFKDAAFELAWAWNQWAHCLPNSTFRFRYPDMGARWTPPVWLLSPTQAEVEGESYLFASLLGNAIDRMGRLVRMAHDFEGSITVEELLATASNASTRWLEWLTVLNIVLIAPPVPSPLTRS